ncbi:NADPH:quinone oxidoreductase family protein [Leifsonia poae]|uniref:NADPH:quinone oxidoreductase family protein n=1 Tax=Leifsonia poae TaxID=110933 RepID=UPI003D669D3C
MHALVVPALDGPAAARIAEVPEPVGSHERARGQRVVVEVHATGLSVIDALQANGAYQYGAPPPYVAGSEIAGVVVEADAGSGFTPGDRVGSIVFWGGLAERAVVAPEYTVKLPDSMDFEHGAAVYLNWSTAWYAYHRSRVQPGDTVLVHGAAGGVGTALLDLAAVFGVRAVAVVSSDEKERVARAAGATAVLRSDGNWLDGVRELTGGHGVDAVLDPVGGDRFTDSLRALRIGGTLVVIGFAGGSIPAVRVNRLLLRNLTVTGVSMDTMDAEHPGTLARVRDEVERLLAEGRIHPLVGAAYSFEDAAAALVASGEGRTAGKIVVRVRS